MDWIGLITLILEFLGPILQDCFEPTPEGVARLRRFGPRIQTAIFRAAKAQAKAEGLSRREVRQHARDAVREAREDIAAASDSELQEFIADLRDQAAV